MAWGMTVAPTIPTARVTAPPSGSCGVTLWIATAAQSGGTMNSSAR